MAKSKVNLKRVFNEMCRRWAQSQRDKQVQRMLRKGQKLMIVKSPEGRAFLPRLDCMGLPLF